MPDEKWALTYAINVTGPYLVADEAKKIWQAQGLKTSTSANAAVAKQGSAAYDTSKALCQSYGAGAGNRTLAMTLSEA